MTQQPRRSTTMNKWIATALAALLTFSLVSRLIDLGNGGDTTAWTWIMLVLNIAALGYIAREALRAWQRDRTSA